MYTPVNPRFFYIKWGMRGYTFHGHVFLVCCISHVCVYFVGSCKNVFITEKSVPKFAVVDVVTNKFGFQLVYPLKYRSGSSSFYIT